MSHAIGAPGELRQVGTSLAPSAAAPIVASLSSTWKAKSVFGVGAEAVTSQALTITASRADARSEFVCVVAPSGGQPQGEPRSAHAVMLRRIKLDIVGR